MQRFSATRNSVFARSLSLSLAKLSMDVEGVLKYIKDRKPCTEISCTYATKGWSYRFHRLLLGQDTPSTADLTLTMIYRWRNASKSTCKRCWRFRQYFSVTILPCQVSDDWTS